MDEIPVVTCFLRYDGRVLLLRRSEAVGSYQGQWGGVAGHVAAAESDPERPEREPIEAAREEILEKTGITDATLVRPGDLFSVEDADRGTRWIVHPFLFDVPEPVVETDDETTEFEWVHPPEILRCDTVPDLWRSYDHVRPRVETVGDDTTHGAAHLSIRALDVLRDEAALAATDVDPSTGERGGNDWESLASLAEGLLAARPSMAVVTNRINRAIAAASEEQTPTAVERAAVEGIERALHVDDEAAANAAADLPNRVATLSRSGTVRTALCDASPEAILVAESQPGGEGVGVAESLAADLPATDVTLTSDAAFAFELAEQEIDAVVVGADRILPDGSVVNKVGTHAAALASPADCETVVVASTDKVAIDDTVDREERDAGELYDGDAPLAVANPTFDRTPAEAVDAIVTERGVLAPEDVERVTDEHRARADW